MRRERRERSGFLLPGILLTALACVGVVILIMSAAGVLPDEMTVLHTSGGGGARRSTSVPVAAPQTPAPSRTPSASPTATPTRTGDPTRTPGGPTTTPAGPTPTPTVTPTRTPTVPPPPACKAGSATVTAVADSFVFQGAPTRNYGRDQTLTVASRDKSRNGRALVRFAAFKVPAGCTVRGVTLAMRAREATGRRILVAPATKAWDESTVTWQNGPWPTGRAAGATVSGPNVAWSIAPESLTAYGFVVYDATENAGGAGAQTGFASRDGRGAPMLTVRWA